MDSQMATVPPSVLGLFQWGWTKGGLSLEMGAGDREGCWGVEVRRWAALGCLQPPWQTKVT